MCVSFFAGVRGAWCKVRGACCMLHVACGVVWCGVARRRVIFSQAAEEGLTLLIARATLPAANWTESTLLATLPGLPLAARLALTFGASWPAASSWLAASGFAFGTAGIAGGVSIAIAIGKAV